MVMVPPSPGVQQANSGLIESVKAIERSVAELKKARE